LKIEGYSRRSTNTGTEMRVVRYGNTGTPLAYLPSSDGDETEFASYGLDEVAGPWVDSGSVQVFSADARGPHTLFDRNLSPIDRMHGYACVERYFACELLPWVGEESGCPAPVLVGTSYGAFLGANLLLKYPARVECLCGLGGVYEMWHQLDGHHDDEVYFHSPFEYLPRLQDAAILGEIRRTAGFTLYAAADDPWLSETTQLARLLAEKSIPHTTEIWPAPADHHEDWWRRQFRDFLTRRAPQPS
jgi:esterase/lipase superfamily enzyme